MASSKQQPSVMLKEEMDQERISIDDLSLESDSGWRPYDEANIQELVQLFQKLDFNLVIILGRC